MSVEHDVIITTVPITLAGNKCPFRSDAHLQRAITAFPAMYSALKAVVEHVDDVENPAMMYARGVLMAIEEEPPEVVPQ